MARKYYVVWKGRKVGVFDSWEVCEAQVKGFPGAQFKAFPSRALAEAAFRSPPQEERREDTSHRVQAWLLLPDPPQLPSICVDAACDGAPGNMEYRGVWTESGKEIFHQGPFPQSTVNIGEFLAIVHGLAWMLKEGLAMPVYTDSVIAIQWVQQGHCRSNLPENEKNDLVRRAEQVLKEHPQQLAWVRKWDTQAWGENPADFGRK